ncbi:MAG: hypothetical protein JRI45_00405 [Deltaproteobacteria bacterium]|nr:hypothetical protein [Deltaproteobacteria bacterium]MBW2068592.1 hypothetical protein [Deltaproteobacteria bacterium]
MISEASGKLSDFFNMLDVERLSCKRLESHIHKICCDIATHRQGKRDLETERFQKLVCPCIALLVKPDKSVRRTHLAFFNSRTGRDIHPHAPWLKALRLALKASTSFDFHYITSTGLLFYDLITRFVEKNQLPHTVVLPLANRSNSCCNRQTVMQCRDRIIAHLADAWVIIQIRPRSSLIPMLTQMAAAEAKPIALWLPPDDPSLKSANKSLLRLFPEAFRWTIEEDTEKQFFSVLWPHINGKFNPVYPSLSFPWHEYLYHYTRRSRGPWPGESLETYLDHLLDAHPLSQHSALDSLINIAREKIIRATGKIVKGGFRVVSWTSVPPPMVQKLKKWNAPSQRWTIEDYGIAVRKDFLKKRGAKPVCYIPEKLYCKLPLSERFRFQKHEPPSSLWKDEKEWRTREDFPLNDLTPDEAFWFVPTEGDARRFSAFVDSPLPVMIVQQQEKGKNKRYP